MIEIIKTETLNWPGAIRGMRNPLNSWEKSDSEWKQIIIDGHFCGVEFVLGPNDLGLAKRLVKAGPDHRKFMRQIFVSVDISAPLYWWKEFDTYKVGTVTNSCSTMHTIHTRAFCREDFSCERLDEGGLVMLDAIIAYLETERSRFLANKEDRQPWHNMIQTLPTSYNQLRTVTLSYENLRNIYHARHNHKLVEWHTVCDWIEGLPYSELITM